MNKQQLILSRILEFQRETGLSVVEFAEKIGIQRSSFYALLNRGRLSGNILLKINEAFPECDIVYILTGHVDALRYFNDFANWAKETFVKATPASSLEKLKEEIKEIEEHLIFKSHISSIDPAEYADAMMCIIDSANRVGIKPDFLMDVFRGKLRINKKREWVENPDLTYSHVK